MPLGRIARFYGRSYIATYIPDPPLETGQLRFTPSVDHAMVDTYEVRVYPVGSGTPAAVTDIGKPALNPAGTITVDLTTFFGGIAAGNYTLTIAAMNEGGETESEHTDAFSLPLV
jgi:hypothetical protein